MPPPPSIPPFLHYACRACGDCCRRGLSIWCPSTERDRLASVDYASWAPRLSEGADGGAGCAGMFVPERSGPRRGDFRLRLDAEGACVFLARPGDPAVADGRMRAGECLMHARLGYDAKLLACRMYPVVFHDTAEGTRTGLLFSCPAVADGDGPPLASRSGEVASLARERAGWAARRTTGEPPSLSDAGVEFTAGRRIPWTTLAGWEARLLAILLGHDPAPVAESGRWLRRLLWAADVVDATDRAMREAPSTEDDRALSARLDAAGENAGEPSRQGGWTRGRREGGERWTDRLLFALCAGMADRRTARPGGAVRAAVWARRATGRGTLGGVFGRTRYAAMASVSTWPMPEEAGALLLRYTAGRVASRHYFGGASWGMTPVSGMRLTLRLSATALMLARAYAASEGRAAWTYGDVRWGVMAVDHVMGHLGEGRRSGGWGGWLGVVLKRGGAQGALRAAALGDAGSR